MVLTLGAGVLFGRRKADLAFAWFVQTCAFVIFNKVCTSQVCMNLLSQHDCLTKCSVLQYFLWYTLFLPLIIPKLSLGPRRILQLAGVWVGTQALWLSEAYKLEFLGQNVFFSLWVRSLVYVIGHSWVLAQIMESYNH
jgi:GPI mannosyltransferase 1 subunit M